MGNDRSSASRERPEHEPKAAGRGGAGGIPPRPPPGARRPPAAAPPGTREGLTNAFLADGRAAEGGGRETRPKESGSDFGGVVGRRTVVFENALGDQAGVL